MQNASRSSSARQWVTIPVSHPHVILQFWGYTWAESLSGSDQQQLVLLAPGDSVLAKPWSVLERDRQVWEPHSFDIIGVAGANVCSLLQHDQRWRGRPHGALRRRRHLWACPSGVGPGAGAHALRTPHRRVQPGGAQHGRHGRRCENAPNAAPWRPSHLRPRTKAVAGATSGG